MEELKNEALEQLARHEAELQHLTVELNNSSKEFIDADAEVRYIATQKRMIEELKEAIEQDKKFLAEVEELIKNPPVTEEEDVEEKPNKVFRLSFEEEIQQLMNLQISDSWKLFVDEVVDAIDYEHRKTIKSVIKEYKSGFDKALDEVKTFITRIISKERTIGINKNLINGRFNHFRQYLNKIVFKAAMKADPPEDGGGSENVKNCCRAVMKNFNEMVEISTFIEEETKDLEDEGFIIEKVHDWIDTVANDEWIDVNDLVDSYNEFHHVVINSRTFGRIMKDKFITTRKTVQKVKRTFYKKK